MSVCVIFSVSDYSLLGIVRKSHVYIKQYNITRARIIVSRGPLSFPLPSYLSHSLDRIINSELLAPTNYFYHTCSVRIIIITIIPFIVHGSNIANLSPHLVV